MLIELYGEYSSEFALQAKSATTNSLTKKSKSTLQAKCKKFDDLSKVDKTSAIIGKVDEVKVQMQDKQNANQASASVACSWEGVQPSCCWWLTVRGNGRRCSRHRRS